MSDDNHEYLVSHGQSGDVGRFRCATPLSCRRGDRVVIRTDAGVEVGVVRCAATTRHAQMLEGGVGELLRQATPEDEEIARGVKQRGQELFAEAGRLARELALPLEILDVEIQLDGHRVTLYSVRWAACDERPLVSRLSKQYEVMVSLRDLALPEGASACGKADCGNAGNGGECATCATGGGCASGCGSKALADNVREYFAGLRQKMDQRVPLA